MLLDTHVWLRWLSPVDMPLPTQVIDVLEANTDLAVSAVSCWEVAYLAKRGRLQLPLPLADWMSEALAGSGISCIPLDAQIATTAAELSDIHRDPADRFIIATALATRRRLLTLDSVIPHYPELQGHLA
ncbi:MAG: type II toxin-antitoxin system VapC family toxin [Rhodoferax sp.]|nr:type II toxin-antitoxin system VapC family toxin [Rhodoferax sp.]